MAEEGPPRPESNPELVALRKDMEKMQTKLEGDIRELEISVEKDMENLKRQRLVYTLLGTIIGGVVVAVIGYLAGLS